MKYIWEEDDIVFGRRVKHKNGEEYIIGYMYNTFDPSTAPVTKIYVLISLLDGLIHTTEKSKQSFANILTNCEIEPI